MQNNRGMFTAALVCVTVYLTLNYAVKRFQDPPKQVVAQESVAAVAGGLAVATEPGSKLFRIARTLEGDDVAVKPKDDKKEAAKPPAVKPAAAAPASPPELIALGHGGRGNSLEVLLTTHGAAVQQVILPAFEAADREGLAVPEGNGFRKLYLVPGYIRERTRTLREQRDIPYPELAEGAVKDPNTLAHLAPPSYALFHYEKPGDERPVDLLGKIPWKVVERPDPKADEQTAAFETELGEPYNLKIRKTFKLGRKDYHIGMAVAIERLPGKAGGPKFRYQIAGANHLPLEGEWHASTYRTNIIGVVDPKDRATRSLEDAASVHNTEGSDATVRSDRELRFAGTMIQYFASVLCVDDQQVDGQKRNFIERVRSTPIGKPIPEKPFLDDLTVRAVSEELDPETPITHRYLLYHGPVKVRLLKQLEGDREVDPALVDRYKDVLHLAIMTDAPMPNIFGRFAGSIGWSDLVIGVTNLIHSLLYQLHGFIPWLGVCIVCVTIIVRGNPIMFLLSRKQTLSQQVMKARMDALAPEIKQLEEQYGSGTQDFNAAKTKLMMKNGVNPFAMMGGCFIVILQMPIFMGLYYALQESVFFRLEPFLWFPNLGAPDMLLRWGENVPMISAPENMGSGLYLGPYLNILPLITVSLMMFQQQRMMPTPTTEQEKMQQTTMKFMMVFMAFMFYKSASGLCLYFMASSIWSIVEKSFIPKFPKDDKGMVILPEKYGPKPKKPLSGWRKKVSDRVKDVMEQAEKQKQHQRDPMSGPAQRAANRKKRK